MNATGGAALPQLKLRRHEERRIRSGHDWVFSNEIDTGVTPLGGFGPGAAVRIVDARGAFVAHALANPHALICARIVSRVEAEPIGPELIRRRLEQALALRSRYLGGSHYRLVFGESDGLPGLVIDRFGDVLVAQSATWGMERLKEDIDAALMALLAPQLIVWKNDGNARTLESLPREVTVSGGPAPETLQVREGVLSFEVPLSDGQKTGWFYDQTANRARLAAFLPRGARVLDVCSYAGGWAVSALGQGAAEALCLDSSAPALEAAARNAALNGFTLQTRRGDAFEELEALAAEGRRFEVVIVDPPAFIKRRKDQARGEAAYRRLNALALRVLAGEGLLVSCSCSFHLDADMLPVLLQSAARHAGRTLRILASGGQSPDHPVHPAMPETRYLKALYCHVSG
ncbi:MAG: class I SAM-dependent rRNA methyltransferase [Steroidobacteraceae bacterium]